jgi:hypothetical protein
MELRVAQQLFLINALVDFFHREYAKDRLTLNAPLPSAGAASPHHKYRVPSLYPYPH